MQLFINQIVEILQFWDKAQIKNLVRHLYSDRQIC